MCQKEYLNKFNVYTKNKFKIKCLQTIYNVKWTFTQKKIPRQNDKHLTCF